MTQLILEAIILVFFVYPFAHMVLLLKEPPGSRSARVFEGLFLCLWALSILGLIYAVALKAETGELALRTQVLETVDILGVFYAVITLGIGGALIFHALVLLPSTQEPDLESGLLQKWEYCSGRCAFRYAFIVVFLLSLVLLILFK